VLLQFFIIRIIRSILDRTFWSNMTEKSD
jgi:hypothetical protein